MKLVLQWTIPLLQRKGNRATEGLLKKYFQSGYRRSGVRMNGNYRRGGSKNCPLTFLSWPNQNPNFFSFNHEKAGTFFHPNKAKPFICQCFYNLSASPTCFLLFRTLLDLNLLPAIYLILPLTSIL